MSSALLCHFSTEVTIAPSGTEELDVPIDRARDWTVLLDVTGIGDLDALSYKRSPLGDLFGPAVVATGVPIATGQQGEIGESGSPLTTVRLFLGSTGGCTVAIRAGGR